MGDRLFLRVQFFPALIRMECRLPWRFRSLISPRSLYALNHCYINYASNENVCKGPMPAVLQSLVTAWRDQDASCPAHCRDQWVKPKVWVCNDPAWFLTQLFKVSCQKACYWRRVDKSKGGIELWPPLSSTLWVLLQPCSAVKRQNYHLDILFPQ